MSHTTNDFEHILRDDGVQAVSYEETEGTVKVFVEEKLPEDQFPEERLVSHRVPDHETDVIEVGDIEAQSTHPPDVSAEGAPDHRGNHEPPIAGVSEIQEGATAATAGLLATVTDPSTSTANWDTQVESGDTVRLSNAHVYGHSRGELDNPILQPSPYDGGTEDDAVGSFAGFVPLEDSIVDAAARTLTAEEPNDVLGISVEEVERVRREGYDELADETLCKSGRTTGVTTGQVRATDAAVRISYGSRTITKRGQLLTTAMSQGGDSGSPVFRGDPDAPQEIVGHIFAGSDHVSVVNRIVDVEQRLGVKVMTETGQTDQPATFKEFMAQRLATHFGEDNVRRNHRLPTGRYIDFLVENHAEDRLEAWELENSGVDVVSAAGQALFAAESALDATSHYQYAEPVVCTPHDTVDDEERTVLERMGVTIHKVNVPDGVATEGV